MEQENTAFPPPDLIPFLEQKSNEEITKLFSSGTLKFCDLPRSVTHFLCQKKVFSIAILHEKCKIPSPTLYAWAAGRNAAEAKMKLLLSEELALIEWADCLSQRGFQVSKDLVCSKARLLCPDPNFQATGWWRHFLKRHPEFVRRRREFLGKLRARSCSVEGIRSYFDLVRNEIGKVKLIGNIDETGVELNAHSPYTFCRRGAKNVPATCQDRARHITAVGCIFSDKTCLPPYFIFTGKRASPALKALAPVAVSENGWMTDSVLAEFIDWFLERTPPLRPFLLIWDGLTSHTQNAAILDKLTNNNIICISLAPHSSHLTQPLDKTVYGPLKAAFGKEMDRWNRENPTSTLKRKEFVDLFTKAWDAALNRENIKSAFESTGLHPFNPSVVLDKFKNESPNSTFARSHPNVLDDDNSDADESAPKVSSTSRIIHDDDKTSDCSSESTEEIPARKLSSRRVPPETITTTTTTLQTRNREMETEIQKLQEELASTRKELDERKRHGRRGRNLRKKGRIEKDNNEKQASNVEKPVSPSTFRGLHCRSPEASFILSLPVPVANKVPKKKSGRKCRPAALLTSPEYIDNLKSKTKKK